MLRQAQHDKSGEANAVAIRMYGKCEGKHGGLKKFTEPAHDLKHSPAEKIRPI
jgi:hypothetical protein